MTDLQKSISAAQKKSAELHSILGTAWKSADTANLSKGLQILFHQSVGITKALGKINAKLTTTPAK